MGYVPLAAGRFDAREILADGHWLTLVESPAHEPYGSIAGRHLPASTRKRPKTDGTIFAAGAATWFLPAFGRGPGPAQAIIDQSGTVRGHIEYRNSRTWLIHLPGDTLVWERHSMSPAYRIEGGYIASRSSIHQLMPGFSHRPFTGTIGPRIADRPDGALALLLAAWFTAKAIDRKVEKARSDLIGQPT